jgi:hypothetical protein
MAQAALRDASRSKGVKALVGVLDDQQRRAIVDRHEIPAKAERTRPETRKADGPVLGRRLLCGDRFHAVNWISFFVTGQ